MLIKRLLIFILLPFILSACTGNKCSEEITFTSWGSATEVSILNRIIQNFEEKNPEIKVKFEHIPQNYFQKLHLLFASNQAPDVIFINNLYLPLYASYLEELDNLIDKNDYYPESLKSMSYEGSLLAAPRDISNLVFYRNRELTDSTPSDINELINATSKIKPFYKSLEGKSAPAPSDIGSSTMAQMFLDGKIAFYLSGRWMYPKIKEKADFNWDVIPFPGIVPLDSSGWAVSKNSKHKMAAEKFVQYLSSKQNIEYFNSTGLIVPARTDVSKEIDNKVFLEAIERSKVLEIDKNYKKRIDKMNKELFN